MSVGERPTYSGLVFRLAWANTWRLLKSRTLDSLLSIGSLAIGSGIYLSIFGWRPVKEQIAIYLAFALAPGALFLLFAFLWNLCLASDQLIYDAIKRLPNAPHPAPLPPKPKPINWKIWRHRDRYSACEFAAILARDDPASSGKSLEQTSYLRLVVEALLDDSLACIPHYLDTGIGSKPIEMEIDDSTEIRRDEAIRWAEEKEFDVSHVK